MSEGGREGRRERGGREGERGGGREGGVIWSYKQDELGRVKQK